MDRLDKLIKDKLEDYSFPKSADWALFYSYLEIEQAGSDWALDDKVYDVLEETSAPDVDKGWALFESQLDALNEELDAEFDAFVGHQLENINYPYQLSHWQKFTQQLGSIDNKTKVVFMKVMEIAAVLLIIYQLTNAVSVVKNTIQSPILSDRFEWESDPLNSEEGKSSLSDESLDKAKIQVEALGNIAMESQAEDRERSSTVTDDIVADFHSIVGQLNHRVTDFIPGSTLHNNLLTESSQETESLEKPYVEKIETPTILVESHNSSNRFVPDLPALSQANIAAVKVPVDSILSSVSTLQVIRPRLQSSLGFGVMADVSRVHIEQYFDNAKEELVVSPGAYMSYTMQYGRIFGGLGVEYNSYKYTGASISNEVDMVTLPVMMGYNFVNIPELRVYISAGVAGRFVPVAKYNFETFNLRSDYEDVARNKKKGDGAVYGGLLNKEPFHINSYLAGRINLGMDIQVNKNWSVGLKLTHNAWLKGDGIGYNFDKFKSTQLSIGGSLHF